MSRGPPESPLQVPRPPVVSMHTMPSPTMPYTALHSALDITGMSSTHLRTGEMPPAESEGLPQPLQVTVSLGSAVSPAVGRQDGLMYWLKDVGEGNSIRAMSLARVLSSHWG